MLKIVLTVCSILSTEQCKTINIMFAEEGMTPMHCIMGPFAQMEVSKWKEAHPNWSIQRWRCEEVQPGKDI